jgi:sugar lactone lactonase YvrE
MPTCRSSATGTRTTWSSRPTGRAYVGNFGFDLSRAEPRATALVRVDPDGRAARVAEELLFPNGCVLSDDGRTLIVAETWAARLTEFAVDGDGMLSNQRTFAVVPHTAPDGCTLDAEAASGSPNKTRSCSRLASRCRTRAGPSPARSRR